jgi:ABC-type multidrug transport system ATPase subunit
MNPVLELQAIGLADRLETLSFSLYPGETVVLLGANGAGKTTLLRLINGSLIPSTGQVLFENQLVSSLSSPDRQQAISLFEQVVSSSGLTVIEYLQLISDNLYREIKISLVDLLIEFDLVHLKSNLVSQLSGGEKQRLQLARLELQEPKVLLLDEPSNHLDLKQKERLGEWIKKTTAAKIIVTHDLTFVREYAQRVLFIKKGAPAVVWATEEAPWSELLYLY